MVRGEVCVKDDDVCEAGGGRVVCDTDVRERIVDKDCMEDGVWQHVETDGVCDKDGMWQMVCDKDVCEMVSASKVDVT